MAQNNENIINHWSFATFANEFGKVVNRKVWTPEEGPAFATLSFRESRDTTKATFVHFSSKLGELSGKELKEQMDRLQIIQRKVEPEVLARRAEKGHQLETYILCKQGELDYGEELDLF